MTAVVQNIQQLQQDLQNELTMTTQLLRLISVELQKIKILTSPNGEFDANIRQNSSLVERLAHVHQVNVRDLPPLKRAEINIEGSNENMSIEQHENVMNTNAKRK